MGTIFSIKPVNICRQANRGIFIIDKGLYKTKAEINISFFSLASDVPMRPLRLNEKHTHFNLFCNIGLKNLYLDDNRV